MREKADWKAKTWLLRFRRLNNMPKIKISKSLKDRIKVTANGKLLRRVAGHRHLKASKRKTNLYRSKKLQRIGGKLEKKIKKMLSI